MEQYPIHQIDPYEQFPQLAELPQPPRALFARGTVDYTGKKILAIVAVVRVPRMAKTCAAHSSKDSVDTLSSSSQVLHLVLILSHIKVL